MTPLQLLDFTASAAGVGLTALTAAIGAGAMRGRASRYLTALFTCLTVQGLICLIAFGWREWLSVETLRWLHSVNVPAAYLLGPLLYGYARALTSSAEPVKLGRSAWHAVPCLLVLGASILNAVAPLDTSPAGNLLFRLLFRAWVVQGIPYLILAAWQTHRARHVLEQLSADDAMMQLSWLRRLVAVLGLIWVAAAVDGFLNVQGAATWVWFDIVVDWTTTVALGFLAGFALRQHSLIPGKFELTPPVQAAPSLRYARSALESDQCAKIADDLRRLMSQDRLYVDSRLDLQMLSECSGWSPNYLSQALSQGLRQNFFEFVNGYRVAAAERCLADVHDDRTILDIAIACGFGSKSTFNTVFKRLTGCTPSEFRRTRQRISEQSAA